MTRAVVARERRREEARRSAAAVSIPPALRAEQRARVQEAVGRRERILAEAKKQRRVAEREVAANYDRIREQAQRAFETERDAIRVDIERRAAGA